MELKHADLILRSALLRASRRMAARTDVALGPSFETPSFARLLRMRFIDDIDMIRTSETPY
jgi:hypothetical protein